MRARRAVLRARSVWKPASRTAARRPLRSLRRSTRQRRRRRAGGVACASGRHRPGAQATSSPRPRHRVGVGRGRCNGDPPYAVITPFLTAASRVGANPDPNRQQPCCSPQCWHRPAPLRARRARTRRPAQCPHPRVQQQPPPLRNAPARAPADAGTANADLATLRREGQCSQVDCVQSTHRRVDCKSVKSTALRKSSRRS